MKTQSTVRETFSRFLHNTEQDLLKNYKLLLHSKTFPRQKNKFNLKHIYTVLLLSSASMEVRDLLETMQQVRSRIYLNLMGQKCMFIKEKSES